MGLKCSSDFAQAAMENVIRSIGDADEGHIKLIDEIMRRLRNIKGPKNILVDNFSRLERLITPAQLAEGKNLVKPAC
eukprot:399820-Ditylum_brightwellii.AAC.1